MNAQNASYEEKSNRLIIRVFGNAKHPSQLLASNHILLPRSRGLPKRIRRLIPTMRDTWHTMVVYSLSKVVGQPVSKALAFCEKHVPFAAEENYIVW